jgi:hypothetical protein
MSWVDIAIWLVVLACGAVTARRLLSGRGWACALMGVSGTTSQTRKE